MSRPLIKLIDEPGHQIAEDGTYRLSEAQARAILELRLQRLTGLERDKIAAELDELAKAILDLLEILDSRARRPTDHAHRAGGDKDRVRHAAEDHAGGDRVRA